MPDPEMEPILLPATPYSFSPLSLQARKRILNEPPTEETLERAWCETDALREVELRNPPAIVPPRSIRMAAWNLQQSHFPEEEAMVLAAAKCDLALLTEIDVGLRRSGQRHGLKIMARTLERETGRNYGRGMGVEFLELIATDNLFNPTGKDGGNSLGFHGNGWLSRLPARRPFLARLPAEADWFVKPRRNQRRIGGRVAVAATFSLAGGDFVAASVHLESDTDPAGRRRQMRRLLDDLDAYAMGLPVVVGGDFNAGAGVPGFDHAAEGLFAEAAEHGYDWHRANTLQPTSRPSRVANLARQNRARYDWFFVRGLEASDPAVIPAVDEHGEAISDHDAIAVTLSLPEE